MRRTMTGALVALALLAAACGSDDTPNADLDPVAAAEAKVAAAEKDVTEAQAEFDEASTAFCEDAESYIAAVDRYGNVFDSSAATVGDVKTAGADLAEPRKEVTKSVEPVKEARDDLAAAEADLAAAQVELVEASSGTTTSKPSGTTTTSTTEPLVPPATVDRIEKAEADLAAAQTGISNSTPVAQAAVQFNSAAFALEVAWLRLFADAGCLEPDQHAQAVTAVTNYTTALQTVLKNAGLYSGEIDGVYGPATVDAVEQVQSTNGLPVTGYVDQATAAAINSKRLAVGGAVANETLAYTSAVQSTLKLAGYWDGPVDGNWTPALTDAVLKFQTDLGVTPTGVIDSATLHALETKISDTKAAASGSSSSTTTTASGSSSTTSTTSTTAAAD